MLFGFEWKAPLFHQFFLPDCNLYAAHKALIGKTIRMSLTGGRGSELCPLALLAGGQGEKKPAEPSPTGTPMPAPGRLRQEVTLTRERKKTLLCNKREVALFRHASPPAGNYGSTGGVIKAIYLQSALASALRSQPAPECLSSVRQARSQSMDRLLSLLRRGGLGTFLCPLQSGGSGRLREEFWVMLSDD